MCDMSQRSVTVAPASVTRRRIIMQAGTMLVIFTGYPRRSRPRPASKKRKRRAGDTAPGRPLVSSAGRRQAAMGLPGELPSGRDELLSPSKGVRVSLRAQQHRGQAMYPTRLIFQALATAALMLAVPDATRAQCFCEFINGVMQPMCGSSLDIRPRCGHPIREWSALVLGSPPPLRVDLCKPAVICYRHGVCRTKWICD